LATLLKFTRTTGHVHPNLRTSIDNYYRLLKGMSFADGEVAEQLLELAKGAGLDDDSALELFAELFKSVEVAPSSVHKKRSRRTKKRRREKGTQTFSDLM
jgi:hypothetical protein